MRGTPEARVFAQLKERDGCWEWTGSKNRGYGRVRIGDRKVYVHRWTWEFMFGPIPEGLEVDHLCFNPPCANPWHLDVVTHLINTNRGRKNQYDGNPHCHNGHAFDATNTYHRGGKRHCRKCRDEARARFAARHAVIVVEAAS